MSSSLVAREDVEKYLRESGDVPAANVSQLAVSLSQILEDFAAVDDDERSRSDYDDNIVVNNDVVVVSGLFDFGRCVNEYCSVSRYRK